MAMPQAPKVRDESVFKLDWKGKNISYIQQIRQIATLSMPTLQRLYARYFKEDASECMDPKVLVRKLQYMLQYRWYRWSGTPMHPKLRRRTKEMMALSIGADGRTADDLAFDNEGESPMAKIQKDAKVKETPKLKTKPVPEPEEDDDEDIDDLDEDEDEGDGNEDEDDDDGDEDEEEEEAEETPKRKPPARTGEPVTVKLKGTKFKAKFIYEFLVPMFAMNNKLKATDAEITAAVKAVWPNSTYEMSRVNADRKKYNAGRFQNQSGTVPEKTSKEWDAEGNKIVRVVPPHLAKQVELMKAGKIKRIKKADEAPAKATKVTKVKKSKAAESDDDDDI